MSITFTEMMDSAQRCTRERDWPEAAEAFASAAHLAGMGGRVAEAWRAWTAAGACWRRADQADRAERCLRRAMELTEPGGDACRRTSPQLAGVLVDLGEPEAAEDLLESVAADAPAPITDPLFLDTRIGALFALGRKEAGRVHLTSLRARSGGDPLAEQAVKVRQAQLLVMDGALVPARAAWRALVSAAGPGQREPALVASMLGGLAGTLSLLGEERDALEIYEDCSDLWRQAGRQGQSWSAEAARVRTMVALGVTPLPGLLDAGLSFARERHLRPLLAGLHLARGLARAESDPGRADQDLTRAMELGMDCGLPVMVGRAAYERARRLPMAEEHRQALLETAAMACVSHVPLAGRVALARARQLARSEPRQALSVARACLPRLERMGMRREVLAARALVRQLGGHVS